MQNVYTCERFSAQHSHPGFLAETKINFGKYFLMLGGGFWRAEGEPAARYHA